MQHRIHIAGLIALLFVIACSSGEEKKEKKKKLSRSRGNVVFFEDFEQRGHESLPAGWWVEGCEKVWVENGKLRMKANPSGEIKSGHVCTVWNKQIFSGDLKIEFDARVLNSTIDANNINFFFLYSDPKGTALFETREFRANAAYKLYHHLNGYIFTFLNDFRNERKGDHARIRIRRCPGFELMTETYDYHCREKVTYHVTIQKVGEHLSFGVDDRIFLRAKDEHAWTKGLIGLRTFQTHLWWDNIRVTQLK